MTPRKEIRLPVEGYLAYSGAHIDGEGTVTNLSRSGWRVTSTQLVPPGTPLWVSAVLPEMDEPLEVELATVRWSNGRDFGLETLIVGKQSRERLRQFFDERPETSSSESQPQCTSIQPLGYEGEAAADLMGHPAHGESRQEVEAVPWNQRYFERYPAEVPIRLIAGTLYIEGLTVDLSPVGCMVRTEQSIPECRYASLILIAPQLAAPLKVELAAIRWADKGQVGLEFIRMSPIQQKGHRQLIESLAWGRGVPSR